MRELEGADAAVGGEIGVENDEPGVALGELEQRLAVGLGDVLVRRSTRRARSRPRLRLALEAVRRSLERVPRLERELASRDPEAARRSAPTSSA